MPAENDNRTKIFDAFVVVDPRDPLIAVWPDVTLSETQHALLSRLLSSLHFLGRAESWVEAKISEGEVESYNAVPLEDWETSPADDREIVRLLAAEGEKDYRQWRTNTRKSMSSGSVQRNAKSNLLRGKLWIRLS